MRARRIVAAFALLVCFASLWAETQEKKLTVVGKLVRVMAMGGESTGWTIELESEVTVDGKNVRAIEVAYAKSETLEKLANKRVRARGAVTHRHGVETGDRVVLELASIRELKSKSAGAFDLAGKWRLEDLAGSGMIANVRLTMEFPSVGKVVGTGGCNRFFGTVEGQGGAIKFGPLASSRKMCPEAVMNQEGKYLVALQAAERWEWKDASLLVYSKGMEKPLRFAQVGAYSQ